MSSSQPGRASPERSLFIEALEKTSTEARNAYLDETCAGDAALRHSLDDLLGAHEAAGAGFLAPPSDIQNLGARHQEASSSILETETIGRIIGPYEITDLLGEGAFARVYRARQRQPVQRDVAVKILKPGMDSRQIIARFESERQALAMMNHPNIAQVYDAGTTEDGRLYFVMGLAEGETITEFCDTRRLDLRERLRIFIQICRAVQHAHQKAIIHRDLKPSNILVTQRDGIPVPMIIDFGIAKAIRVNGPTDVLTHEGQFLGTPQYMSPEQAGCHDSDVDTRSDIYSLGVILFELITGSTPLDKEDLCDRSYTAMEQMIRNEEAPRPSLRLASLGTNALAVAEARDTDLSKLVRQVRGGLDWIALKALEKDPNRRYEAAAVFSRDLERFLNHEPVAARSPSVPYLAGRFIRRNRTMVAAATATLLSLIAGILITIRHAHQIELAHQASETARLESEAVTAFLENTFRSPGPDRAGRTLTVAEMLALASERLHEDSTLNAANQARLFTAVGRCYASLGLQCDAAANLEAAVAIYSGALGNSDPVTLDQMKVLADAYRLAGDLDQAIATAEAILERLDETTARDDPMRILALQNLADTYRVGGRLDEAALSMEEAAEAWTALHGPNHPTTLNCLGRLTQVYQNRGERQRAISLQEDVVERSRRHLGDHSPATAIQVDRLARVYLVSGRADQAYPLASELVNFNRLLHGDRQLDTLSALFLLARIEKAMDRLDDAIAHHTEVLQSRLEILGPDHFETLESMSQLATCCHAANRNDEALPLAFDCVERRRRILGSNHYQTSVAENSLAKIYFALGMNEEAIALFRNTVDFRRLKLGSDSPLTLNSMNNLATACCNAGNLHEGIRIRKETLAQRRRILGPEDLATLHTLTSLGNNLIEVGRIDEAVKYFEEALAIRETRYPDNLLSIRYLKARLAQLAGGAPAPGRKAGSPGDRPSP